MKKVTWLCLIIMDVFLIGWSYLPVRKSIVESTLLISEINSYSSHSNLVDTKFEYILQTITPEYIDKLSSGTIILKLERKSQVVGEKPTGRTGSSLGLKASVNIVNTEIYPGRSTVMPFVGQNEMKFEFVVSPSNNANQLGGDVLISMDMQDLLTGEIDHYLLYAIPIQMKIRTLVGIRPDMVRVFSTAAFIFLLIVRLANFQIER
jgi:hypothetical protein